MSWKGKAWAVAGTVAEVEELKEKKLCKWSSCLVSLYHHHVNDHNVEHSVLSTQIGSSTASSSSSPSSSKMESRSGSKEEISQKQSEESLRMIMYLSCWGPN